MTRIFNILIAFLAGIIGFGILYLLLEIIAQVTDLGIYWKELFPVLLILFSPLYEELGKYLSIKIWKITNPYAIFFGLAWSILESFSWYINHGSINLIKRIEPTTTHILTSIILAYFIKRKQPIRGLIIAIVIHIIHNIIYS